MRKETLRQIGLLTIFVLLLFLWHSFFRWPWLSISAFEAVPTNSALIVEWTNKNRFDESIKQLDKSIVNDVPFLGQLDKELELIKPIFQTIPTSRSVFEHSPLYAILQPNGANRADWLFIMDRKGLELEIKDWLNGLQGFSLRSYVYQNKDIYTLYKDNRPFLSLATYRNLLLFGKHAFLVEESIYQLEHNYSTNICRSASFKSVNRQLSKTPQDMQVYLNTTALPFLSTVFITPSQQEQIESIASIAQWIGTTIQLTQSGIDLNGALSLSEESDLLSAIRTAKRPLNRGLLKILPDNVAIGLQFNWSDRFMSEEVSEAQQEILNTYFLPWIEEDMTYFLTQPFSAATEADAFISMRTKDMELTEQLLEKYEEANGLLKLYDYKMFTVKQIMGEGLFEALLGKQLQFTKQPFYVTLENYVIFANSRAALEVCLDRYIANQVILQRTDLESILTIDKEARGAVYVNPRKFRLLFERYFRSIWQQSIATGFDKLEAYDISKVNLRKGSRNTIRFKAALQASPIITRNGPTVLWKTRLQNMAILAPQYIAKNETILTQDADFRLYAMTTGGRAVWDRVLEEPILSTVHAIDYYKDGSVQYLFNTASKIYVLDEAGKEVGAFPIRLKTRATNGVMVTDFDKDRNYSYFVACENRHIYGFDRTGRPLIGWNPKRNVGLVPFPLQHIQLERQDMILTFNNKGKLNAYGRRGNLLFTEYVKGPTFLSPIGWQADEFSQRLAVVSVSGTTTVINFDGKSFKLPIQIGNQANVQFEFMDIVEDKRKDYVVMSNDVLATYAYTEEGFRQVFDYQYDYAQDDLFEIKLSQQTFIGTYSKDKKRIFLLNKEGKLQKGFPLAGTSRFWIADLLKDNGQILVVANDDSIYAYRL